MPSVPHNPQAHHRSHRQSVLREAWVAGSCASVLSALALGWAGHREVRSAAAPLNAVSHWRWGRRALFQRGISGRHTLLGFFIHHCASVWWAGLHAAVRGRSPRAQQPAVVLAGAAATSATASTASSSAARIRRFPDCLVTRTGLEPGTVRCRAPVEEIVSITAPPTPGRDGRR